MGGFHELQAQKVLYPAISQKKDEEENEWVTTHICENPDVKLTKLSVPSRDAHLLLPCAVLSLHFAALLTATYTSEIIVLCKDKNFCYSQLWLTHQLMTV